jgi:hypothetical protein
LAELAARCISGMNALGEPTVGAVGGDTVVTLEVPLNDVTRCVRAALAGGPGVDRLELSIEELEGSGRWSRGDLGRALVLVPEHGPLCVPSAGRYRLTARARRGQGQAALQLYQAR